MNIFLIVTILLTVVVLALVLFGSEAVGSKVYKAFGAAAMTIIGAAGLNFVITNTLTKK